MKTYHLILFTLALLATAHSAFAQKNRRPTESRTGKEYSLKDNLWYGGFFGLGFGGGVGSSAFGINLSPMVGYKILPPLSVGPRVGVGYTYQKIQGVRAFNLFDTEVAVFARLHVFQGFFLHGEIGTRSDQYIETNGIDFTKTSRTRPLQVAGIGYNFSGGRGGFGQEIAILYDFFIGNDINSFENPWQYRFAITYGF